MANDVRFPAFHREAAIVAGSLDEKQRTFGILWTAGAEVQRFDWYTGQRYIEVLEVSEAAIRLGRLESGRAPVLDSHQRWQLGNVMGVIEKGSAKVEGGTARATVRMSNREELSGLIADIRDGIIANVSPGYITHAYREEVRDGKTYRTATDWEPIEISFVPVGADPDAGLARGAAPAGETFPCTITRATTADVIDAAAAAQRRMALLADSYRL
ncbi:hypothetical protein [Reyranella sp.]|uniref:hypothetical protein n=1 Tax=Reyranella sp. TaxID=1929291 RepID=UPI003D09BA63